MKDTGEASELFRSTAYFYARFRKPCPDELFTLMTERFGLDGTGALLDLGCGTGQVSIPLGGMFSSVVALDASGEMIAEAERAAGLAGAANVQFHTARTEDFSAPDASFKLVTLGSALHWMDIDAVLMKCRRWLEPQGGLAIVGMRSIWGGDAEWEQAVVTTVQRWLGSERHAGSGIFGDPQTPYSESLAGAGFVNIESGELPASFDVDIPFIIGHLYSTSYCNRAALGSQAAGFERDLRETLLAVDPAGTYTWSPGVYYVVAFFFVSRANTVAARRG